MVRRNAPALKVVRGGKSELEAANDSFDGGLLPQLEFPGPSRGGSSAVTPPPEQPASPPPGSEEKRGRFRLPLLLSILVHVVFFACLIFAPRPKPAPEPPKQIVIELELAAQGTPEAPEAPPAPPPQAQPAPPPEQAAPPPEPQPPPPEVQKAPEPQPPPAPDAEAVPMPPPVTVKPEPRPQPPEKKAETPPEPAPQPQPEAPPAAVAPTEPTPAAPPGPPAPAAPPGPAEPRKGIETGVSTGTSQAEMNRYITTLFTMIDAKKVYPPQSLQRHEQGTVVIRLKIAADGKLVDANSPTDGLKRLVDASLDAVHRAAPFPPLPASLNKSEADFEVPVVYKLQ
jgi:protein TonB